jgi:FAD/FMN-containing dehydrogenase
MSAHDPDAGRRGTSWGNMFRVEQRLESADGALRLAPRNDGRTVLPYGRGRSVGDVCLNDGGVLLTTERLRGVTAFDPATGTLECLAGTTFADLIDAALPHGWFPPVVPSTKYLTVGGAIANDVHGRDHARSGSFGCHVEAVDLVRSDGAHRITPDDEPALFRATLGGLGLTGLIVRARIRLKRVPSPFLSVRRERVGSLEEAIARLCAPSSAEYRTVWLDGLAPEPFRHGFLEESEHVARASSASDARTRPARARIPRPVPGVLVNGATIGALNRLLLARVPRRPRATVGHFESVLYTMDGIADYYNLYGRAGFLEFQGVVPDGSPAIGALVSEVAAARNRPLFTIVKRFGDRTSGGLLSFPMRGVTFALDFKGTPENVALVRRLNAIVVDAGGRVYPAKDACLDAALFRRQYPRLDEFETFVDPALSSSFWRRVHAA